MNSTTNTLALSAIILIIVGLLWLYVRAMTYPRPRCVCGHQAWQHDRNGKCLDWDRTPGLYRALCTCRHYTTTGKAWVK